MWGFGGFGSRSLSPFSGCFSLSSGRFSLFAEFLLNIDGVAGDVFATLTKEEPDKNKDRATEGEEAVFDGVGPVGSEENDGINYAKTDSIEVAAGENQLLCEREIAFRERIFRTIVGMTEKFAVEDKLKRGADDGIIEYNN